MSVKDGSQIHPDLHGLAIYIHIHKSGKEEEEDGVTHRMTFKRLVQHHLPKVFPAILGDLGLLFGVAVVLKGEDDGVLRRLECALRNGFNDFLQS